MSHRCGAGCYRKQGRRSECPSCNRTRAKRSAEQVGLAYVKKGRRYARRVMRDPHPYWQTSRENHPEPSDEFIEQTLTDPFTAHSDTQHVGRTVYYRYIPDARKWLQVVVQDDHLFNAYFNQRLLRRWGRPEETK